MKKGIRAGGLAAATFASLLLVACAGADTQPPPPRPVWVVQPQATGSGDGVAFPGEVHARQESPLAFRVGGNLVRRLVDAGARVSRGQVLAELDPGDQALQAQAAQAQLAAAEAEATRARGDLERYRALDAQQLVSRSAFEAQKTAYEAAAGQARAARAQWEVSRNQAAYTELRAPHDGVVASREAEAGQVVAAGQTVFTLAADGGREVAIALPEDRVRQFKVGDAATVELWSAPGRRLPARIREIAPAADTQTRSYAARVALDDAAAAEVDLGQSARVFLGHGATAATLRVPLAAVQRGDDGRAAVWLARDGKAVRVPVKVGEYGSDSVPVEGALKAGDWVVAAGGHLLREDEPVTAVDRDNRPVAAAAATQPKAD